MKPAPTSTSISPIGSAELDDAAGVMNMQQLIQLRWFAASGQVATICIVHYGFGILLPLQPMLAVLSCLLLFNLTSLLYWRTHREVSNGELFIALLVDVGALTAQLYLSGGVSNPFTFLYLLQVTLGAVLLRTWATWTMVAITTACFAGLSMFARPLPLPMEHELGLYSPYVEGILVCFMLNAVLLVVFITRIESNLRQRDARLASLRQRAAEEEHIVRMGLLASGAAHELGTPLATLAVILGDWKRMPSFAADPELLQEIGEMQAQVKRCKSIVSGILSSAGETRGESPAKTSICTFLDALVREWRATRSATVLVYDNQLVQDLPMVSDSTIQQMICNVLDNAFEASPRLVRFEASCDDEALVLRVTDAGPGFLPAMLAHVGKPYQSTKGRAGSGLGLFLVVNVARTLGGTVSASNPRTGGAEVRISLPLASIVLQGGAAHVH
jgi:two-component system sensor histidine kinase RegB